MSATIHTGDALETLKTMGSESVHCVITSPPYWGLRQYFFDGASILRRDLDAETRGNLEMELQARGIKPKA